MVMKTLAYLRVSKDSQDVTHQRLAVLKFARHAKREIDDFMELRVSSRRSPKDRQLDVETITKWGLHACKLAAYASPSW
jgi:hypothetical protein